MKYKSQIGKYQNAGSIPAVNEYGLTEEEMSSVRDNMRRYGLSEEDAVRNKIKAKESTIDFTNEMMSNLDGLYGDIYNNRKYVRSLNKMALQDANMPNIRVPQFANNSWKYKLGLDLQKRMSDVNRIVSNNQTYLDQYQSNETKSEKEPFNEQISPQISTLYVNSPKHEITDRERARIATINEHNDTMEAYKKMPKPNPAEWFSLLQQTEPSGTISNILLNRYYRDAIKETYDKKYNEYLEKHPIKSIEGIGYNSYMGTQHNPYIRKQGEAHNYAVQQSGYDGENPIQPYIDSDNKFAKIAGKTLFYSMFAPSAIEGGIAPFLSKWAGAEVGSRVGEKVLGDVGAYLDKRYKTNIWQPVGQTIGSFGGWSKGWNIGSGIGKLGWASIMNKGWARKFPNSIITPAFKTETFDFLNKYGLLKSKFKPTYSSQQSIAYRTGGILKSQQGGLIYKPFFPEQEEIVKEESYTNPETISYEPEDTNEPFAIEPVRIYGTGIKSSQESIVEQPVEEAQEEPIYKPTIGFTEKEMRVLYNDGSNEDKRRVSIKYLQKALDLTIEQAAAIVGQWQRESNFKLNAENKEEKAGKNSAVKSSQYGIGIGQWTGTRHDAFVKYINTHGGTANLKTQLDFAIEEIKANPDFLNNLRNAKTLKDASAYVYVQYVAAQHKGIKGLEDLYAKVNFTINSYRKKHNELYGRSSNMFNVGLKNAEDSLKLI